MTGLKGAKQIKAFLDYMSEAEKQHTYAREKMQEEDKRTQDLLHQLELEETTYADRAKLGTRLAISRKSRRYYKDVVEETETLVDFIDKSKPAMNNLREVLGKVRKAEYYHSNRTYKPKVEGS